ncbi:hypothetical protein [Saccharothrix australiensis]|uniref:Uncharacterized protein n=1 Tax=Saccharothrix australiensis TaxID=2072 RepID=A0A495W0U8_9PSEU|nr:hypothetical protein [Saccharothrix australiensis]RKT55014.1 hypothetical protein C8E97_3670 [Saccharothrix australiensis]
MLVEQHFVFELVEALKNDEEGFPALVAACTGFSGGDEATISVLFAEVSAALDAPGALDSVLGSPEGPAVASISNAASPMANCARVTWATISRARATSSS